MGKRYKTSETTCQAISGALKQLMTQKPLERITVAEIMDTCGMRRQHFYYYFTDIYDLLRWTFEKEALELLPTSFAWRTFGGRSHSLSDGYEIETNAFDYQGALLPQKVRGVEMSFRLAADAVGAGAMLGLYDENGYLRYPLFVSIESSRQCLILCKGYGLSLIHI